MRGRAQKKSPLKGIPDILRNLSLSQNYWEPLKFWLLLPSKYPQGAIHIWRQMVAKSDFILNPNRYGGRSWHGIYFYICCDWEKQLKTYWQFSLKTFLGLHFIISLFQYWKFEKFLKSNTLVHIFFKFSIFSSNFHQIVVGR